MTIGASDSDCLTFVDTRGWSIKHGRARRLLEPKRGKAAIRADIQGQGKEVLRGRTAFSRTVGHRGKGWRSSSPEWLGKYGTDYPAKRRRVKCRKLAIADSEDVLGKGYCLQMAVDEYFAHRDFQMYKCGMSDSHMSETLPDDDDEAESVSEETTSYFDAQADEDGSIDSISEVSYSTAWSCQSTVPSMVDTQSLPNRTKVDAEYERLTLWELALIRAEVNAQLYELFVKEHGRPVPEPPGWRSLRRKMRGTAGKRVATPKALSLKEKLLKYCNTHIVKGGQCHGKDEPENKFKASHQPQINAVNFEKFREQFLADHGMEFCRGLHSCFRGPIQLEPTPLWQALKLNFLEAATGGLTGSLVPAFHGTDSKNLSSIYKNGFMIPGQANNLKVAHGSAHGLGIYAATLNNPGISWGFCSGRSTGNESMLVCGVIDDSVRRAQAGFMGHLPIHSYSGNIRRVGDAIVAFDRRRIAPLFVASRYKPSTQTNATNLRSGRLRKHVGPRSSFCSSRSKHADSERRRLVRLVGHSVSLRPRTKERRNFQQAS